MRLLGQTHFFKEEILNKKTQNKRFPLSYEVFVREKLLLLLFSIRLFLIVNQLLIALCFLFCRNFS